jgi:Zn-dependent protease
MMSLPIILFQLFVFIFSVIIHEVSHGLAALKLGDTTAKDAGRLTLNPIPHLDFFGSFILPLLMYFASGGALIFGWAKPVPYDPRFLKNPKLGGGLIAGAGPLSNLTVAVIFGLALRLLPIFGASTLGPLPLFFHIVIFVNILLAVFNLVPIPPLDGSKVLFAFLPSRYDNLRFWLERYGIIILLFFIFYGFILIRPIIALLYNLIAGSTGLL